MVVVGEDPPPDRVQATPGVELAGISDVKGVVRVGLQVLTTPHATLFSIGIDDKITYG